MSAAARLDPPSGPWPGHLPREGGGTSWHGRLPTGLLGSCLVGALPSHSPLAEEGRGGRRGGHRASGFFATYLTPKTAISRRLALVLGMAAFAVILVVWSVVAVLVDNPSFLP